MYIHTLKKVTLGLTCILLLSFSGSVLYLTYQFHQLNQSLTQNLSQMQQATLRLSDDLHGTSQNLNAALIQIGLTTDEARRAATEQRAYWARNSAETHTVLANVDKTITTARGALVMLTMDAHEQITTNGTGFTANLIQLQHGLVSLSNAAEDLDRLTLHIDHSVYNVEPELNTTLANMALTSANVSDATNSIKLASKDVQEKVHQLTRPVKWWTSVGGAVLKVGSEAGSWLAGFFK